MRKLILLHGFLLWLCVSTFGQIERPTPRLVESFGNNYEDVYEGLDNIVVKLRRELSGSPAIMAIRVCSNQRLGTALVTARGIPFFAASKLVSLGVAPSKILFLRKDQNCAPGPRAVTEYWIIPDRSEFPEFIEAKQFSDVSLTTLVSNGGISGITISGVQSGDKLNQEIYKLILAEGLRLLQVDRQATLTIEIPIYGISNPKLDDNYKMATHYFISHGIASFRIYSRRIPFARPAGCSECVDIFPSLYFVHED